MNDFFEQVFNEANHKITTDEFVKKAKKLHPEYDYSKVNYTGAFNKVEVICPKHGSFLIMPSNLLGGSGCKQCANERKANTTDEIIEKAKMFHPEYDYSKINYVNSRTKVIVTCPEHGDFFAYPKWLTRGVGCPMCSESKGESFIEVGYWTIKFNLKVNTDLMILESILMTFSYQNLIFLLNTMVNNTIKKYLCFIKKMALMDNLCETI